MAAIPVYSWHLAPDGLATLRQSWAARSAMHPRSPVRALDALLRARQG
ncbi:hypothetical protein [Streptomyces adustus]